MISDKIKQIRRTHYLNQTEFANRIGVTQGAVSQWENGLTRPNLDQIRAISAAFNISVSDIVDETEQPRRDPDALKKLEQLKSLLDSGAITREEYEKMKADLMERL
jgi:transcriptional regulator with XRE-family HTH domain